MHLSTLVVLALPFIPSILSHPVVDGAEAPSRMFQRRQADPLTSGTGATLPSSTATTSTGSLGDTSGNTQGKTSQKSTTSGTTSDNSNYKLMDGGGLLAACASASLGSPSSNPSLMPLSQKLSTTNTNPSDTGETTDSTDATDSTGAIGSTLPTGLTPTSSASLTSPTGATEKRQVEKRQSWHTHMAQSSPQDFANLCSMVEKYSQQSTTGKITPVTQKSPTTNTEITEDTTGDTTGDSTGDSTGDTAGSTDPTYTDPTSTDATDTTSVTTSASTTGPSTVSEKKMKRANGW